MIAALFGVMYFMMIRPQQKRRREAEQMQATLGTGDEVITIGGLYGTVVSVDDDTVTLEVAPGVLNRYARPAIARVSNRVERADAGPTATEPVVAEPVATEPVVAEPVATEPVVDRKDAKN